MCCGTADNSYQTVAGMKIIFADGSTLDTRSEKSKVGFQKSHSGMIAYIEKLGESVKANEELLQESVRNSA